MWEKERWPLFCSCIGQLAPCTWSAAVPVPFLKQLEETGRDVRDGGAASPSHGSCIIHLIPFSPQSSRLPLPWGCSSSSAVLKTRTFTSCGLSFGSTSEFPETW